MTSRITAIAYVFLTIIILLLCFFILRDYDEQTVIGANTSIVVTGVTTSNSGKETVASLERLSRESGATIIRLESAVDASDSSRTLYVTAGGSAGRSWLQSGYPAFSRRMHTSVLPLTQLSDSDPRGIYFVSGTASSAKAAEEILRKTGGSLQTANERSLTRIFEYYLLQGPLGWLLFASMACVVLMVAAGTVLDSRRLAVQAIQGWGPDVIYLAELIRCFQMLLATAGLACIVMIAMLYGSGRGAHWLTLLELWLATTVVSVAALATAHYVILRITRDRNVLGALRGRLRSTPLTVLLRTVHVAVIFITLLAAGQLASSSTQLHSIQQSSNDWSTYGNLGVVELRGATYSDTQSLETVGAYANAQRRAGHAFLAQTVDPQASLGAVAKGLIGQKMLIVDSAYLQLTGILDPLMQEDPHRTHVHVLLPSEPQASPEDIRSVVAQLLPVSSSSPQSAQTPISISRITLPTGSLTFGSIPPLGGLAQTSARESGLIIIVIPTDFGGLPDREAGAYVGNGAILFTDHQQTVRDVAASAPLSLYILDVKPLRKVVTEQEVQLHRQISILGATLPIGLASLVIFSLVVSLSYTRAHAQRIWAQTVSGWSFWLIHLRLLAIDCVIILIAVGWVAREQFSFRSTLESGTAAGMDYFHALLGANKWALPGALAVGLAVVLASIIAIQIVVGRFVSGKSAVH